MANITKQMCDFCDRELSEFHNYRTLVFETKTDFRGKSFPVLQVMPWDDEVAMQSNALHFENDTCAKRYIERWLDSKRSCLEKAAPRAAEDAGIPVDLAPVVDAEYEEVAEHVSEQSAPVSAPSLTGIPEREEPSQPSQKGDYPF